MQMKLKHETFNKLFLKRKLGLNILALKEMSVRRNGNEPKKATSCHQGSLKWWRRNTSYSSLMITHVHTSSFPGDAIFIIYDVHMTDAKSTSSIYFCLLSRVAPYMFPLRLSYCPLTSL